MLTKQQVTGLILSGGKGSRVGGQDKGLLTYQGTTLIERQIKWLKPQVNSLLISANRNIVQLEKLGYTIIQDINKNFEGPLHGINQALKKCNTDMLFVHPVDVPNLPEDIVNTMINHPKFNLECQFLVSNEREHYLSMLIHKKHFKTLNRFLSKGNRRVRDFHHQIGSIPLKLNISERHFKNLNFSSDY